MNNTPQSMLFRENDPRQGEMMKQGSSYYYDVDYSPITAWSDLRLRRQLLDNNRILDRVQ